VLRRADNGKESSCGWFSTLKCSPAYAEDAKHSRCPSQNKTDENWCHAKELVLKSRRSCERVGSITWVSSEHFERAYVCQISSKPIPFLLSEAQRWIVSAHARTFKRSLKPRILLYGDHRWWDSCGGCDPKTK